MDQYSITRIVGQGSFGKALLCRRCSDNKACIIKQIDMTKLGARQRSEARREALLLSTFCHPNIVRYWESFPQGPTRDTLCIVMDYADGGDLYSYLKGRKGRPLDESLILDWFVQTALALKHIHDRKVLHRDIKPQNIFLTRARVVKLGDFGIAKVLTNTMDCAKTSIGSPYYMSPEICQEKRYNHKSDIWSLGCVLYEMACLKHTFEGTNLQLLVVKICTQEPLPIPARYSSELCVLLSSLLEKNPRSRPSTSAILRLPLIKDRIGRFLSEAEMLDEFSHTVLHGHDQLAQVAPSPVAAAAVPANLSANAPNNAKHNGMSLIEVAGSSAGGGGGSRAGNVFVPWSHGIVEEALSAAAAAAGGASQNVGAAGQDRTPEFDEQRIVEVIREQNADAANAKPREYHQTSNKKMPLVMERGTNTLKIGMPQASLSGHGVKRTTQSPISSTAPRLASPATGVGKGRVGPRASPMPGNLKETEHRGVTGLAQFKASSKAPCSPRDGPGAKPITPFGGQLGIERPSGKATVWAEAVEGNGGKGSSGGGEKGDPFHHIQNSHVDKDRHGQGGVKSSKKVGITRDGDTKPGAVQGGKVGVTGITGVGKEAVPGALSNVQHRDDVLAHRRAAAKAVFGISFGDTTGEEEWPRSESKKSFSFPTKVKQEKEEEDKENERLGPLSGARAEQWEKAGVVKECDRLGQEPGGDKVQREAPAAGEASVGVQNQVNDRLLKVQDLPQGGVSGLNNGLASPPRYGLGLGNNWFQKLEAQMGAVKAQVNMIKSPLGTGHSSQEGGVIAPAKSVDGDSNYGSHVDNGTEVDSTVFGKIDTVLSQSCRGIRDDLWDGLSPVDEENTVPSRERIEMEWKKTPGKVTGQCRYSPAGEGEIDVKKDVSEGVIQVVAATPPQGLGFSREGRLGVDEERVREGRIEGAREERRKSPMLQEEIDLEGCTTPHDSAVHGKAIQRREDLRGGGGNYNGGGQEDTRGEQQGSRPQLATTRGRRAGEDRPTAARNSFVMPLPTTPVQHTTPQGGSVVTQKSSSSRPLLVTQKDAVSKDTIGGRAVKSSGNCGDMTGSGMRSNRSNSQGRRQRKGIKPFQGQEQGEGRGRGRQRVQKEQNVSTLRMKQRTQKKGGAGVGPSGVALAREAETSITGGDMLTPVLRRLTHKTLYEHQGVLSERKPQRRGAKTMIKQSSRSAEQPRLQQKRSQGCDGAFDVSSSARVQAIREARDRDRAELRALIARRRKSPQTECGHADEELPLPLPMGSSVSHGAEAQQKGDNENRMVRAASVQQQVDPDLWLGLKDVFSSAPTPTLIPGDGEGSQVAKLSPSGSSSLPKAGSHQSGSNGAPIKFRREPTRSSNVGASGGSTGNGLGGEGGGSGSGNGRMSPDPPGRVSPANQRGELRALIAQGRREQRARRAASRESSVNGEGKISVWTSSGKPLQLYEDYLPPPMLLHPPPETKTDRVFQNEMESGGMDPGLGPPFSMQTSSAPALSGPPADTDCEMDEVWAEGKEEDDKEEWKEQNVVSWDMQMDTEVSRRIQPEDMLDEFSVMDPSVVAELKQVAKEIVEENEKEDWVLEGDGVLLDQVATNKLLLRERLGKGFKPQDLDMAVSAISDERTSQESSRTEIHLTEKRADSGVSTTEMPVAEGVEGDDDAAWQNWEDLKSFNKHTSEPSMTGKEQDGMGRDGDGVTETKEYSQMLEQMQVTLQLGDGESTSSSWEDDSNSDSNRSGSDVYSYGDESCHTASGGSTIGNGGNTEQSPQEGSSDHSESPKVGCSRSHRATGDEDKEAMESCKSEKDGVSPLLVSPLPNLIQRANSFNLNTGSNLGLIGVKGYVTGEEEKVNRSKILQQSGSESQADELLRVTSPKTTERGRPGEERATVQMELNKQRDDFEVNVDQETMQFQVHRNISLNSQTGLTCDGDGVNTSSVLFGLHLVESRELKNDTTSAGVPTGLAQAHPSNEALIMCVDKCSQQLSGLRGEESKDSIREEESKNTAAQRERPLEEAGSNVCKAPPFGESVS